MIRLFSKYSNVLSRTLGCFLLIITTMAQSNEKVVLIGFGLKLGTKVENIDSGEKDKYLEEIWDYKPPKPLKALTFYDLAIFEQEYVTTINGGGNFQSQPACREKLSGLLDESMSQYPSAKRLTKEELRARGQNDEAEMLTLGSRSYIKLNCELIDTGASLDVTYHLSPADFLPRITGAFGVEFGKNLKDLDRWWRKGKKYILYPAPEKKYGFPEQLFLSVSPENGRLRAIQAVKWYETYDACKSDIKNVANLIQSDYGITLKKESYFYKFSNSSEFINLACTKTNTEKSRMFLDVISTTESIKSMETQ